MGPLYGWYFVLLLEAVEGWPTFRGFPVGFAEKREERPQLQPRCLLLQCLG